MTTTTPVTARVRGLTKRYGDVPALDDVGFDLREGVITGLLGRNGAGKTTLMRILTGQEIETSGEVRVLGGRPFENETVLPRLAFVSEGRVYPGAFQVRHVLQAGALLHPNWDDDYAHALVEDFGLPLRRNVRKLSRGMQSALGIVTGLASRAPFTLFDEPYLGLDAAARQLFYDRLLADYAENPRTILLSTHLIDEVSDLIEHVLLLHRGRVLVDEDAEMLRGRAVTVTGPAQSVDTFVRDRDVLHRDRLSSFARVTVLGAVDPVDREDARALGLDLEPVSLQQLVVRTTGRPEDASAEGAPAVTAVAAKGDHR